VPSGRYSRCIHRSSSGIPDALRFLVACAPEPPPPPPVVPPALLPAAVPPAPSCSAALPRSR
jgi:hypothetical protein